MVTLQLWDTAGKAGNAGNVLILAEQVKSALAASACLCTAGAALAEQNAF